KHPMPPPSPSTTVPPPPKAKAKAKAKTNIRKHQHVHPPHDRLDMVPLTRSRTGTNDAEQLLPPQLPSPRKRRASSPSKSKTRGTPRKRVDSGEANADQDEADIRDEEEIMEECGDSDNLYRALDTGSILSNYFPPPESARTGPSSPARNQRWNLENAEPSVLFIPFESQDKPSHVTELFCEFIQGMEAPIPVALKVSAHIGTSKLNHNYLTRL